MQQEAYLAGVVYYLLCLFERIAHGFETSEKQAWPYLQDNDMMKPGSSNRASVRMKSLDMQNELEIGVYIGFR